MSATITPFPLCWPMGWPRQAGGRTWNNRFKNNTFARARDSLQYELEALGAGNCLLSTNVPLNLSGQPRGDYQDILADPGVAVYFTLRDKPMVMARDEFTKVSDNLRSLALAIEHLRGMHRHGGAQMIERAFSGFLALPPPSSSPGWREVLGIEPGYRVDAACIESYYRDLAKSRHPDVAGGSEQLMAELNHARDEALAEIGRR